MGWDHLATHDGKPEEVGILWFCLVMYLARIVPKDECDFTGVRGLHDQLWKSKLISLEFAMQEM